LAALGLVAETDDGRIALTALGASLRADAPDSIRDAVLFLVGEWSWRAWGALLFSVRTGQPAFDRLFGMSNFAYWEHDPAAGAIHDAFFQTMAGRIHPAIVAAYDFARFGTLVDVGGGTGALLAAILQAHPALRGILFDRPQVVAGAAPVLAAAGVAERCTVIGGDFFAGAPTGGDAYLLKYILHDWDDARAGTILRHCRAVMERDARLLLVEHVLPDRLTVDALARRVTRLDLEMLILTPGGRERTAAEFRGLLQDAGFALQAVRPTASPLHILEATPV
jgi:hypothetical protein